MHNPIYEPLNPCKDDTNTWLNVGWNRYPASKIMWKPGVYALIVNGKVMYVGSSASVGLRVTSHSMIAKIKLMGYKVWQIEKRVFLTEDHINIEKELIRSLDPLLNTHHKTRLVSA